MDLRRLEYFLAVVEHGRVTTAAAELRIAQPSLSQSIRALETDLGVQLFRRDRQGLTPTAAGLALVEPARRVLHDLAVVRAAVAEVVELAGGRLDVACHELLGADPLVGVIAEFHARHAGVPVRLFEPRDEEELTRALVDGRCELGITYLPVGQAGLVSTTLGADELWVVLPPGTPVPDPLPVAELADRVSIDPIRGFVAPRTAVQRALRAAGVVVRPVVRTRHRESIVPLVLGGVGIAFTNRRYALEAAAGGAVARRLDPPVVCEYALLHRDGPLSPAARAFARILSEGETYGSGL